ncbi:MAG: D-alanine--D-alanine ligase A [bacterium ADurb.Bin400]|nr:MAG: D-alanine--D-alanine ligase A [bacterium ADurb.Bin400]
MSKIRVAVLFGGRSAEHEVSLLSALNIIKAIDNNKFEVVAIGIDKSGQWYLCDSGEFLVGATDPKTIALNTQGAMQVELSIGARPGRLITTDGRVVQQIDVVFPVLHGTYGEDGSIQGLLKLAGVPFVGAGVLGSAVGMDKDAMKRLLRDAGIPVARFLTLNHPQEHGYQAVVDSLGQPFFVKPANQGSSVGVYKVHHESEWHKAICGAFKYDRKVIVEEYIEGREIECSVLGNGNPVASLPGEIVPQAEFYSYEAKYIDENGAILDIPSSLPAEIQERIKATAIKAFQVLCCEGMARVDFFLRGQEVIVNEINTIPGFTKISMYPKLWEASGLSYTKLISRLIELALERHEIEEGIKTDHN